MLVEQIIIFGHAGTQRAEQRIKGQLLQWKVKWFGPDDEWAVELNQVDEGLYSESMQLKELINDNIANSEVAYAALKIIAEDSSVLESSLVNELGRKITSELVDLLNNIEKDSSQGIRSNPYEYLNDFVLTLRIADACVRIALPVAMVLHMSRNINIARDVHPLDSISLGDINGTVRLNVLLQGAQLTVEELLALEVGDVLTLEHSLATPAIIKKHGGGILLEGHLGKVGMKKSISVTRAGRL